MPLLKYKCDDCDHVFEELTSPDKKPACPNCTSANTRRFYQGKCLFGSSGGKGGGGCGSGCSGGNCSCCHGG